MNYDNVRLIDELAAQYALGTLRGPARRRFERLCQDDPSASLALRRWEDRLLDLTSHILPAHPSALVWPRIRQRIHEDRGRTSRSWITLQWAAAAGIAALVTTILWWTMVLPMEHVVTIVDQQQSQLWRIESRRDRAELRVAALPALSRDAAHAYELWALPPQPDGAPVSLGLLPQSGRRDLRLSDAQRVALTAAEQVAISLEPLGGSPTGAPTGPVLFVAAIAGPG